MIANRIIGSSVAISNPVISMVPINRSGVYVKISNQSSEKLLSTNSNKNTGHKSKPSKISPDYLAAEKVQKMLFRLLTEMPISKQKLAESLGITVKNLLRLYSSKFPLALIPKINLCLIKLYCETNFNNQQEEKKRCNYQL
jgi:hypothetical protein